MRRALALIAVSTLLVAGCGGGEEGSPTEGSERSQASGGRSHSDDAAAITIASAGVGEILVDAQGMTLYAFLPDLENNGKPTCYDECAEAWPPLEASGKLTVGDGLERSLLGSVKRRDDATQVTYDGLPLYLFSGDEDSGDTNGQGLNDVWWVVSPEGEPLKKAESGGKGGYEYGSDG